jgi:arginine exporter protein ArgO
MVSMPFHAYIEAFGCVVETIGLVLVPFSFIIGAMPLSLFLLLIFLAFGYGTMLSVASVLMQESTLRRYPKASDVMTLLGYAFLENIGYRQLLSFWRTQGVWRYVAKMRGWEVVSKVGAGTVKAGA